MARELFQFKLFGKIIVFEYVGTARPGEPGYDVIPPAVDPSDRPTVRYGLYRPIPLHDEAGPLPEVALPVTAALSTEAVPVVQQASAATVAGLSIEDRLKQLNDLRDRGIVTEVEYQERRARILGEL